MGAPPRRDVSMSAQTSDWLVFRGHRRRLFSYPLEPYLRYLPSRPDFRLRRARYGYEADWEIRADDTLWLTGLITRAPGDGIDPGLAELFPDAGGPVPATWVELRLNSSSGDHLRYDHHGYQSRYTRE